MERYPTVQLATLVSAPPTGRDWIHEIKFDGFRLLGFVCRGVSRLRTRNGKDWTDRFPTITKALESLTVQTAVIDMEAVVVINGRSSFQHLQKALGEGGNPSEIVGYAFDLLYLDGEDITRLPLLDRKEKLKQTLDKPKRKGLLYTKHLEGDGAQIFQQSCRMGLEGIVSKDAQSRYTPGRQKAWLKTKCTSRQEFIILGFSQSRSGPRAIGALYLGYTKSGKIQFAGKVGTGFTMKSAHDLAQRFASVKTSTPTLTRSETRGVSTREYESIAWVKPSILCEVEFTEWTNDGRVRHPSFQGLREDKAAGEVRKEEAVPTANALKGADKPTKEKRTIVAGIVITHPDRVISSAGSVTKGDLAQYYGAVAPYLLPRIAKRPLSLLRCPSGIDGECFYQRNPGRGMGPDVHPFEFTHKGRKYQYLYIDDERGLLELVQMSVVEIHPWGARIDNIDSPDQMIFDLDPAPDVNFETVKAAATELRQRLRKRGLDCTLKCTGGKGLHVTVPLAARNTWREVKDFAATIVDEMVKANPKAYIATMSKAKRAGRIFLDYFRNDYTATAIADFSVRARPGTPVALPIEWRELKSLTSADQFSIGDVLARLKKTDVKSSLRVKGQILPGTTSLRRSS
jgi:bifunctional non-homologous end joining protein LigD